MREVMQTEENQPEYAAKGNGRVGIDETTLIERVEPSFFGAAGDRLLVHLSSSRFTACPADTRTPPQSSNVPVEEPEQVERVTASQQRFEFEPCLDSEISQDLANEFQE